MKLFVIKYLLCLIVFISSVACAETRLQYFNKDSYQSILKNYKQQSFLLVLWSLDCPPCMEELSMLEKFHKQYPDKKIILVSVDSKSQSNEIQRVVNNFGLHRISQWVFNDDAPQYLRYSIDPSWYGELPRSYFHLQDKRNAVSGKLIEADVIRWFNAG